MGAYSYDQQIGSTSTAFKKGEVANATFTYIMPITTLPLIIHPETLTWRLKMQTIVGNPWMRDGLPNNGDIHRAFKVTVTCFRRLDYAQFCNISVTIYHFLLITEIYETGFPSQRSWYLYLIHYLSKWNIINLLGLLKVSTSWYLLQLSKLHEDMDCMGVVFRNLTKPAEGRNMISL